MSTSQESEYYAGTRFYTAINYTLLQYPTIVTSYGPFEGTTPLIYFSLPADLSLVDPAWKGCIPDEYGAFDPPRTLGVASALVSQDPGTKPTPTAAPGSSIAPVHVPASVTPGPTYAGANPPQSANPAPDRTDSGAGSNAQPTPSPPNLSIAKLQIPHPLKPADPPTDPIINSVSISAILQGLANGQGKGQGAPESPDPTASGSNDGGDPGTPLDNDPNVNFETKRNSSPDQMPADPGQPVSPAADPTSQGLGDGGANNDGSGGVVQPIAQQVGPVLIDSQSIVRAISGGLLVGSSTIAPGSQTVISGHTVSAGLLSVLVDGDIYALPTNVGAVLQQPAIPSAGPVLIANQSIVRDQNGGLIIGGSTVAPGSQTLISGHIISAGLSSVFLDGSAFSLPTRIGAILSQSTVPTASPVLIDGQPVVRAPNGGLIFGSLTVAPGSQITASGHILSAGVSSVRIDGSAYPLPTSVGAILQQSANLHAITLANGATISAGGAAATLAGTTNSIASDGSDLIANDKTIPFPTTPQSVFTVAGETFTAGAGDFVIAGTTVALDGSAVTVSGTVVSLGPLGLQIGSSTIPVDFVQAPAEAGLGSFILAGLDGAPRTTDGIGNVSVAPFTGGSSRLATNVWTTVLCIMGVRIGMASVAY